MLAFHVILAQHPRRPLASFLGRTVFPTPYPLFFSPLTIEAPPQSWSADPDPVGNVHCPLPTIALSPLAATLMDLPASVANKRLTAWISPLDATLTKNTGGPCLSSFRGITHQFPFWNSSPSMHPLFFSTTCGNPFCNPFLFIFMQEWCGCTPLPSKPACAPVLSSAMLTALQTRKRDGNDRADL